MTHQYISLAVGGIASTETVELPVNTPDEIEAARLTLAERGDTGADIWELPAAPEAGGDYADARRTGSRLWAGEQWARVSP